MTRGIYRFSVGGFECVIMEYLTESLDSTKTFDAPPGELEAAYQQQGIDPTAAPFSINILCVKTPPDSSGKQHQILIDTGLGYIEGRPGAHDLVEDLRAAGIQPNEIDFVVITHGHGDHIGGLTDDNGQPVYANARHIIWKGEWETWTAPERITPKDENDRTAFMLQKKLLPLADRIELIEQEQEVVPGVCLFLAPGHTLHQIAVEISDGGETLFHAADALHEPLQVAHPDWSLNFDVKPEFSVETRRSILHRAAQEKTRLMTYHFPFPGLGRVTEANGAWTWEPIRADPVDLG